MKRSFFFFLVACGGGASSATVIPGQPPPRADTTELVPASTDVSTFAVDRISLGEGAAWKSLGYDLDRTTTTKDSTNVCTLLGGLRWTQVDGTDGIDNAFGSMVVPLIHIEDPTPSQTINDAIAARKSTLQLVVTGLPSDLGASAVGLRASTFVGADASASSDPSWPVTSGTEADFFAAYVTRGTFVSDSGTPVRLDLPLKATLSLLIHDAVITFERTSADVIEGTIAGVLDATELGDAARDFALRAEPSLCTSTTLSVEGIVAQVREAADIQDDGTNAPGVSCGGISIGVGFRAHRIASPTSTVAPPPQTPPCK